TLPRPTFSPLEPFAPRPFKISSTETLLPRASPHSRVGAVPPLRQNEGEAWFIPFGKQGAGVWRGAAASRLITQASTGFQRTVSGRIPWGFGGLNLPRFR